MNVSGNPTPVIIDQVREIRFQRQANSWFTANVLITLIQLVFLSVEQVSEVSSL